MPRPKGFEPYMNLFALSYTKIHLRQYTFNNYFSYTEYYGIVLFYSTAAERDAQVNWVRSQPQDPNGLIKKDASGHPIGGDYYGFQLTRVEDLRWFNRKSSVEALLNVVGLTHTLG